jgi:predicted GNAT superfamily acetyltransferase
VDVRDDCVYVGKLAVAARMRRRGVARRIFDAVEALAREQGKPCIELERRIELVESHETFAALGFRQTAERAQVGYERPTFITMRRAVGATAD